MPASDIGATYASGRRPKPSTKCEILNQSRCFPVLYRKRTLIVAVGMSQTGQSTKSLRSSPLCGGKNRETGSRG
jgi:hypothetical protein